MLYIFQPFAEDFLIWRVPFKVAEGFDATKTLRLSGTAPRVSQSNQLIRKSLGIKWDFFSVNLPDLSNTSGAIA